ncbi:iron ABC transporter ATP-binding protein [methanogenic archaeon mixed culture ISO4-G1]|nr:iron ABC transporter ATP-binding protein [methanogenic archaeon mixed culture ISO4-G1]
MQLPEFLRDDIDKTPPDFNSKHIIEMTNVTFGYKTDKTILHDVSFTIDEPEFVCIVGPNGVGKSTLIKCMNGLLKPRSGIVKIYGKEVKTYPLKELAKIAGYVPVRTNDFNVLSVLDTVLIGRYAHQSWKTKPEEVAMAYKALEALEMQDYAMERFNDLSAGQHQKVSIARGLVQEPKILILDEPTSNLDIRHQIYVTAFLKKLSAKTGMTIIMISHDLNLAAKFADKVIMMETPGKIHSIGTPLEVFTEGTISDVYNVKCKIEMDEGSPHIVLQYVR